MSRVGTDIAVIDAEERYRIRVTAAPKGIKFWALQYLPYIEVLEPQWLRDEIIESIQNNRYGG